MAIDWEGLLGVGGSRLQKAYDDCIAKAMEAESDLFDLDEDDVPIQGDERKR